MHWLHHERAHARWAHGAPRGGLTYYKTRRVTSGKTKQRLPASLYPRRAVSGVNSRHQSNAPYALALAQRNGDAHIDTDGNSQLTVTFGTRSLTPQLMPQLLLPASIQ